MKILFVCLGNICRSPLAEGILRKLSQKLEIDSAGTSNFHIGSPPDHRMIETAKQHDIDISELAARQFIPKDFEYFDKIVVMDAANYQDVIRLAQDEDHKNKVVFALAGNKDVPDPYFGGKEGFETVYQLLHNACQQILDSIEKR